MTLGVVYNGVQHSPNFTVSKIKFNASKPQEFNKTSTSDKLGLQIQSLHPVVANTNSVSEPDDQVMIPENSSFDIEKQAGDHDHAKNTTIQDLIWRDIVVTVKDHKTKQPRTLLAGIDGIVKAGIAPSPELKNNTNRTRRDMCSNGTIWMR